MRQASIHQSLCSCDRSRSLRQWHLPTLPVHHVSVAPALQAASNKAFDSLSSRSDMGGRGRGVTHGSAELRGYALPPAVTRHLSPSMSSMQAYLAQRYMSGPKVDVIVVHAAPQKKKHKAALSADEDSSLICDDDAGSRWTRPLSHSILRFSSSRHGDCYVDLATCRVVGRSSHLSGALLLCSPCALSPLLPTDLGSSKQYVFLSAPSASSDCSTSSGRSYCSSAGVRVILASSVT